jgi:hypothetical protein
MTWRFEGLNASRAASGETLRHAVTCFSVRAGTVIAATPTTTQASPIHAVGDRRSPRNNTPIATPIGTLK